MGQDTLADLLVSLRCGDMDVPANQARQTTTMLGNNDVGLVPAGWRSDEAKQHLLVLKDAMVPRKAYQFILSEGSIPTASSGESSSDEEEELDI